MSAPWLEAVGGETVRLRAGEHRDAFDQEEILFVESGLVVVRALDEGQRDAFAQIRRAPSVIGFERLDSATPSYELYALTEVVLRVVATSDLEQLMGEASDAHHGLIRCCAETLGANLEDRIAMSGSALVRVARLLVGDVGTVVRFSRVPHHLWAEIVGMRPETLSRALKTLHDHGWIQVDSDGVDILDAARLERFVAEGDA